MPVTYIIDVVIFAWIVNFSYYYNTYIIKSGDFDAGDAWSWIDALTDTQKLRQPSDAEASQLSAALGAGWPHVFLELGIPKAKVEQTQMSHPHHSVAIATLIIHWRQKKAAQAKFIVLLQALQTVNDRCTVDWEVVEKVAREQS